MMRTTLCPLLVITALVSGCQIAHVGKHPLEDATQQEIEQIQTREDVVRAFGVPTRVIESRGELVYRYKNVETEGIAIGLMAYGMGFLVKHTWDGDDLLEFWFDEQGRIRTIRNPEIYSGVGYKAWPFGG